MSDLLSASSLLMAVVAILFSLWYSEISSALGIEQKKYAEDNKGNRQLVRNILVSKAIPVTFMAVLVSLTFLPDSVLLMKESFYTYQFKGINALESYSAVKTAYCLVTLMTVVLAIYMCVLSYKLWKLMKRLS